MATSSDRTTASTDVVELVRQLVRLPSVNPMGQDQPGEIIGEHRVTRFVSEFLAARDIVHEEQPVQSDGGVPRSNLVGWIPGRPDPSSAATIMLQAHQDTVPVRGMTIDPFGAELRERRIWGRGACDVKGGLGTILAVVDRLLVDRPAAHANLVVAFTMNEEFGFTGASALSAKLRAGELLGCERPPDAIVVAEPTQLNVVIGHKGVVRWRCHVKGLAAHSSAPARGVNAIYGMSRLVQGLQEYYEQELLLETQHPMLGLPSLSVGTIHGGTSVNTVPDACVIEIDRRTLPGEDPLEARQRVIDFLAKIDVGRSRVVHDQPFMTSTGLAIEPNRGLGERLCKLAQSCGAPSELTTAPYGTDAAALASSGIPTVVFGPGSIEQAHTEDEWIDIGQLQSAERILRELLVSARR